MSTARVVMRSIWRKASGKYALTVLGLWVLVSLVSLVWTPHTLLETDGFHAWASPSAAHPLATDGVGADVEDALQRAVHDLDDAEHDEEVDQHGHTAGGGLIAVLLLELEQLFLLLFGLVLVLFLDVGDHRLESRHLGHALLLVELQRDADQADDDGEDDDVPAVVRDEVVDPLHHIAERYTEDVQNIHVSVHSAPPVVRDGYFYRRTRRPQFSTS